MMSLFHQDTLNVCHSRGEKSMENYALALECFYSEVIHITSSQMSLTKANHMFTNFKNGKVQPCQVPRRREEPAILESSTNVYHAESLP